MMCHFTFVIHDPPWKPTLNSSCNISLRKKRLFFDKANLNVHKKKLRFTCDFAQLFNCDFPYYIINVKPWKYFFLRLNISIIIIPQSFLGPEFLVIMLPNIRYKLEFFKLFFFISAFFKNVNVMWKKLKFFGCFLILNKCLTPLVCSLFVISIVVELLKKNK